MTHQVNTHLQVIIMLSQLFNNPLIIIRQKMNRVFKKLQTIQICHTQKGGTYTAWEH